MSFFSAGPPVTICPLTEMTTARVARAYTCERTTFDRQDSPCSAWPYEWFEHVLSQRKIIGMTAEMGGGGRVVGYALYELRGDQRDVAGDAIGREMHLIRMAVLPKFQRRGVGSEIIRRLLAKLHPVRRPRMATVVPERALGMQLFLRHWGFTATEVLRGYYERDDQSGYRMTYEMAEAAAVRATIIHNRDC